MHCVYKITFNRRKEDNIFPYYYIGSKSNYSFINGVIIDNRGDEYYGSSNYNGYNQILSDEKDHISTEILFESDNYNKTLEYERDMHIKFNVVLSDEYFNQQIATFSTYSNPEYKTMKNIKNGKVARLLEHEITADWKGVSFGKSWYNNGTINKTLYEYEVSDGWVKGRLNYKGNSNNFYKNGKKETIKKGVETRMKNGSYVSHNKGKKGLYKHSDETLLKLKNRPKMIKEKNGMYGKMWINDGINNQLIRKNDDIPEGWKKGVIRKTK